MKLQSMILLLTLAMTAEAQKFELQYGNVENMDTIKELSDNLIIKVSERPLVLKLKVNSPADKFVLFREAQVNQEFEGNNKLHEINIESFEFDDQEKALFQIRKKSDNSVVLKFLFNLSTPNNNSIDKNVNDKKNIVTRKYISLEKYLATLGFIMEPKPYGLIVTSGNTLYKGDRYVHIFLDQYGNSIFGTIPQGVADRQYVVHVLYLTGITTNQIIFDVKKTKGSFNPALNFLNSDIRETDAKSSREPDTSYAWVHSEFLLGISTTDVEFDVTKTTIASQNNPYDFKNEKVGTYTLKMTPSYHGSFNFGFVNSRLENPTYELVESAASSSQTVAKQTGAGNRGIVTVMATVYTSPIILVEKLFKKDIPWNKTYSRNFLDDHKLFERIYPAIGVGFTDKTFENIFYGVNWEIARGAGIFFGLHWGKVSTFRTDDGFEFEKTPISQAEFDLRQNEEWKTKPAIGINVDPVIVMRIFSGGLK